ncbi:MAG: hypothetical protein CME62_14150 [Halobacteriovoraceae bacterium]|nr:hypothetical protein [Halobacteriovoraceae bacterium]|tara:strand:+ start:2599 stop:3309 length:711 start_codon:yes stop_codon:yes gene_type:complete
MKIFSDFDGTLTTNGELGTVFFDILNETKRLNSELIIVSGRSLSWGHFFLTHFPIQYCLMEGGGVLTYKNDKGEICEENLVDLDTIARLDKITKILNEEIPGVVMSADSFGRRTDRAIEYFSLDKKLQHKITDFLDEHKVNYSLSNVHLNFWLGEISKAKGVSYLLKNYFPDVNMDDCLFFGDALNDESMFKLFKTSIGVSNIKEVLAKMIHKPSIVLEGKENAEAAGVYNYLKHL